MSYRLNMHTPPTAEPIHLTEAKIRLNLAVDADDAVENCGHHDPILSRIISGARMQAEAYQCRALVLQVFDLYLDSWPSVGEIEIPRPPLRLVEFVSYTNSDGEVITLSTDDYAVDTESTPGRIVLGNDKEWPSVELASKNPIQIRFKAGYAIPFSAASATDLITAVNHPFSDGDVVRFSVSGGSLPGGLAEQKDYFVRDVSGDTFKVAESAGGSAVDIASAGSGNTFVGVVPESTMIGMLLSISDRYEGRNDNEQAVFHWLDYDAVKRL